MQKKKMFLFSWIASYKIYFVECNIKFQEIWKTFSQANCNNNYRNVPNLKLPYFATRPDLRVPEA